MGKIWECEELGKYLEPNKRGGSKIIQCHGVFDILHFRHLEYFKQARSFGDVLVVTITDDQGVRYTRGEGKPVFSEQQRAEMIAALDIVDYVGICHSLYGTDAIKQIKPDIYVKGADYQYKTNEQLEAEKKLITEMGGEFRIAEGPTASSSHFLNKYLWQSLRSPQAETFLAGLRKITQAEDVENIINHFREIKVLVLGECIYDIYVIVKTLQKAPKTNILASEVIDYMASWGGAILVANSLNDFACTVLIAQEGRDKINRCFTSTNPSPLVSFDTAVYIVEDNIKPIVKLRFVAGDFLEQPHKETLFQINSVSYQPLTKDGKEAYIRAIENRIADFDMVVVADFGHGLIDHEIADMLSRRANFLTVMVQANESNWGLNDLTKYPRADYICIDDNELRLAFSNPATNLVELAEEALERLTAKQIAVTMGHKGVFLLDNKGNSCQVPALLEGRIVDRIGAGDCFLSLSSLAAYADYPLEIVGFLGNIAGWEGTQFMGTSGRVTKAAILKHIKTMLS